LAFCDNGKENNKNIAAGLLAMSLVREKRKWIGQNLQAI
jgi:hypothetical protein